MNIFYFSALIPYCVQDVELDYYIVAGQAVSSIGIVNAF